MNEQSEGRVVLKKLSQGNTTFEVAVPSSGGSLEEMQQAAATAKTIYDELDAAFNPSLEPVVADEADVPY